MLINSFILHISTIVFVGVPLACFGYLIFMVHRCAGMLREIKNELKNRSN